MKKDPLSLRIAPDLKEALEAAAAADHRTVAGLVIKILLEWLESQKE